jgi:hypothetical protein
MSVSTDPWRESRASGAEGDVAVGPGGKVSAILRPLEGVALPRDLVERCLDRGGLLAQCLEFLERRAVESDERT